MIAMQVFLQGGLGYRCSLPLNVKRLGAFAFLVLLTVTVLYQIPVQPVEMRDKTLARITLPLDKGYHAIQLSQLAIAGNPRCYCLPVFLNPKS